MSNGSCTLCKEIITNPICPDCVQREIVAWLRDNDASQIDNAKDLALLFSTTAYNSTCIVCNRKRGSLSLLHNRSNQGTPQPEYRGL